MISPDMVTHTKAVCPACSKGEFLIDHKSGRYGPWGCKICGANWVFHIDGSSVSLDRSAEDDIPAWLVVRVGTQEPPIYAVIDSPIYAFNRKDDLSDQKMKTRYWVEESTCPTNLIPVDALVVDGDDDPHGILTVIGHVPKSLFSPNAPGDIEEPALGWKYLIEEAARKYAEIN